MSIVKINIDDNFTDEDLFKWESSYGDVDSIIRKQVCLNCERKFEDDLIVRYVIYSKNTIDWWCAKHGQEK